MVETVEQQQRKEMEPGRDQVTGKRFYEARLAKRQKTGRIDQTSRQGRGSKHDERAGRHREKATDIPISGDIVTSEMQKGENLSSPLSVRN
jgi:hypothetical protein